MPNPIPACFRRRPGRPSPLPTPPTAAQFSLTTSLYQTHLGPVTLTWSRTLLTLSLTVDLHGGGGAAEAPPSPSASTAATDDVLIHVFLRPCLLWNRKGSKRFRSNVVVSWDLSRARFAASGGPEPSGGFFVAVAIDGETILVAGDMVPKKAKVNPFFLLSKKEHVDLAGGLYRTTVLVGGKERVITVEIGGEMEVAVDGRRVLHVPRIRWMFRGSERVEVDGARIRVSWDLHSWFFRKAEPGPGTASAAVVAFRFEGEGHFGKIRDWGEGCSGGWERWGNWRRRSSIEMNSFSSASPTSSASGSTVTEWESVEEAELRSVDGFTLLMYPWKS